MSGFNLVMASYAVVGREWQEVVKYADTDSDMDPVRFGDVRAARLKQSRDKRKARKDRRCGGDPAGDPEASHGHGHKRPPSGNLPKGKGSPLLSTLWKRVVLDEAHTIREPTTHWSLGCCALPAEHRWCITGTPVQNKLSDLWALLRFLRVPLLSEHAVWLSLVERPLTSTIDDENDEESMLAAPSVLGNAGKPQNPVPAARADVEEITEEPVIVLGDSGDEPPGARKVGRSAKRRRKGRAESKDGAGLGPAVVVVREEMNKQPPPNATGLVSQEAQAAMARLQAVMQVLVLRRVKADVFGRDSLDLPPKREEVVQLSFDSKEQRFYDRLFASIQSRFAEYMRTGELGNKRASILEMLLRMRQACDHAFIVINSIEKHSGGLGLQADTRSLDRFCTSFQSSPAGSMNDRLRKAITSKTPQKVSQAIRSGHLSSDCPLCDGLVDQDDPGLLPCGHSFCYECIAESTAAKVEAQEKATCPVCDAALQRGASDIYRPLGPLENRRVIDPKTEWWPSAKIRRLMMDVSALPPGDKAVIFSQFTSMLDLVQIEFDKREIGYTRLDGTMPVTKRDVAVHAIREDPNCQCILISLKAGGVGLNLCAANHVILLDPWWNPAVEAQALDRVHRVGQTKPVTARRYIVKDTVEEKLLAVQKKKQLLSDGILGGICPSASKLTVDDLKSLFGFAPK
ncbi:putative SWI/SNF-related matrix-associated actin-dependent regulator of chromatin subfamily A member 3-like 2 [Diplonema papillatum]|nr:putative SWI/SNF-related matrix-associated actin-dependent regulator of chromatin subfamily A member 3-like 2 [Diplonema papillatum]